MNANTRLNEGNQQVTQDTFLKIALEVPFASEAEITEALETLTPKDPVSSSYLII